MQYAGTAPFSTVNYHSMPDKMFMQNTDHYGEYIIVSKNIYISLIHSSSIVFCITAEIVPHYDTIPHPTIKGGDLRGVFQLVQIHFHWGSVSSRGSEHRLNGVQLVS
jgi:hypothetical protein